MEGSLAHWTSGWLSTGYLEGLNSLFSAVKRKARSYRSQDYMIAMLYFVAGKLDTPTLSSHSKQRGSGLNSRQNRLAKSKMRSGRSFPGGTDGSGRDTDSSLSGWLGQPQSIRRYRPGFSFKFAYSALVSLSRERVLAFDQF